MDESLLKTVKRLIKTYPSLTESLAYEFIARTKNYKMDWMEKDIIPFVFANKITGQKTLSILISREGLRTMAASDPLFMGFTPFIYNFDKNKQLYSIRGGVKKKDPDTKEHYVFSEVEVFLSEFNTNDNVWRKKKTEMLEKCLEAKLIRYACKGLKGLYIKEEIKEEKEEKIMNIKKEFTKYKCCECGGKTIKLFGINQDGLESLQCVDCNYITELNEYEKNSLPKDSGTAKNSSKVNPAGHRLNKTDKKRKTISTHKS